MQSGKFTQQKLGPEMEEKKHDRKGWKVGWGRGKRGGTERGRHKKWVREELKESKRGWREVGGGGGGLLPVAIPACPHRQPEREGEREYLGGLQATWHSLWVPCFSSAASDVLPPSLPIPSPSPSLLLPFKASTCHLPPQKQRWEDSLALPLPQGVWH